MSDKTDKDCAQTLVAAAIVCGGDQSTAQHLTDTNLSLIEMARGAAYIASGQPVTGTTR